MSDVVAPEAVFEWRAPIPVELAKKERRMLGATLGVGVVMVLWGVTSAVAGIVGDARFLLVVGLMILTIGGFGINSSRRLRATVVRVDRMGTLTVTDPKQTNAIDLRTVSALSIRRRNAQPQWQWSIEAVHREGAWHAELAALASYVNLAATDVVALETELQRWVAWATGSAPPTQLATEIDGGAAQSSATSVAGAGPIPVRGEVSSTGDAFEWGPPAHPNKLRNRRRLRIGIVGLALLIAVVAAVSEAENGLSAVFFSMFVPVLILVIGFAIDRIYDLGKRFRLGVDQRGLWVRRSSKEPLVVPRSEITSLEISLSSDPTFDANIESRSWKLLVGRADGDDLTLPLPLFLGSSFAQNDAISLEAELRRRLGL